MTRIDDVARMIGGYIGDYEEAGIPTDPDYIARALDDAGHLLPDLPSVKFDGDGFWGNIWEDSGVTVYRGQRTLELYAAEEYGELPETLEPDEARDTAYALLAAADYAERNQE